MPITHRVDPNTGRVDSKHLCNQSSEWEQPAKAMRIAGSKEITQEAMDFQGLPASGNLIYRRMVSLKYTRERPRGIPSPQHGQHKGEKLRGFTSSLRVCQNTNIVLTHPRLFYHHPPIQRPFHFNTLKYIQGFEKPLHNFKQPSCKYKKNV